MWPDATTGFPALYSQVVDTELSTRICNSSGVGVSTVEHLMAALSGTGIFNALVEIDGSEVPILDGSAEVFVQEILAAGVRQLEAPIRAVRVLKEVSVSIDDVFVSLSPSDRLEIFFQIEFEAEAIGKQVKSLNMANGTFVREVCYSRTFCNWSDVEKIRSSGQGRGGSLDNTIVIDGALLLNRGGFRHFDECVRHKILDALGDLALAGAPIFGRYTGIRAGHKATNLLLRALFSRPDTWEFVTCDDAMSNEVPGGSHQTGRPAPVVAGAIQTVTLPGHGPGMQFRFPFRAHVLVTDLREWSLERRQTEGWREWRDSAWQHR